MFYATFATFGSLNERSRSSIKRDIDRFSLKKLMILVSESWNDSFDDPKCMITLGLSVEARQLSSSLLLASFMGLGYWTLI